MVRVIRIIQQDCRRARIGFKSASGWYDARSKHRHSTPNADWSSHLARPIGRRETLKLELQLPLVPQKRIEPRFLKSKHQPNNPNSRHLRSSNSNCCGNNGAISISVSFVLESMMAALDLPSSGSKNEHPIIEQPIRFAPDKSAPVKSAPSRSAPSKSQFRKFANRRLAFDRFAPLKSEPHISERLKSAFLSNPLRALRFCKFRLAAEIPIKSRPEKFFEASSSAVSRRSNRELIYRSSFHGSAELW